jgi:imidazolonepropionase-like amidohydrolase
MKTKERTTMNAIYRICATAVLLLSVEAQATGADDSPSTGAAPAAIAFVNVNVVPMDGERILPARTVVVLGDRIREIGPADTTDIPEGALQIDGRDKYLMPGLVDMHVHQRREWWKYQLTLFIANGVTAVRNMAGDESVLRFREQIEAGRLVGPTIYTTGPIIDGNPPTGPGNTVVETPEQAAQVVAEHKKAGYDFIKVYDGLSLECYDAIIEAAAKHDIRVVGHVPDAVDLEHALTAGQHTVEHLTGYGHFLLKQGSPFWQQIDETRIPYITRATHKAGTWNCPTLVVFQKAAGTSGDMAEQELKLAYMKYVSPRQKAGWQRRGYEEPNHSLRMANLKRVTKALHDAGARILLGTDTPNPYVAPGFSLHQELQNLVDAGLTSYDAIKAGTRDAAECLGELDEFGTIGAGLRADLILVEGNPLDDVGNAGRRVGVMVRGRWFPQSELQAMLDALAIKHAAEENPEGVMLRGRWYSRSALESMVDWHREEIDAKNERQMDELVEMILSSDSIFFAGDGPMARTGAVVFRQLGLQAYTAGDTTAPAIGKADLLIAISPSGESKTVHDRASTAKSAAAHVVLLVCPFGEPGLREISDLTFELGPDFNDAAGLFGGELARLIAEKRR